MSVREILERANAACRRLGHDEDGVVLGVMVVTLMALFLMAAVTFAVGEHIRDRIEIQNAVDAAAYSAAVVQADTISRIAAINQAMAWTYIQMIRRHMDYIADKWLEEVYKQYYSDREYLERHVLTYRYSGWNYHFTRHRNSEWHISDVLLNGRRRVSIREINRARLLRNHNDLAEKIDEARNALVEMGKAQDDLIANMPKRMRGSARDVIEKNLGQEDGDFLTIVFGEKGKGEDGKKSFTDYDGVDERHFLRTIIEVTTTALELFGEGSRDDQWFGEYPSQPWRRYFQQDDMLRAEWDGFADGWRRWAYNKDRGVYFYSGRRVTIPGNRSGVVLGQDVSDNYFRNDPIRPRRLKKEYFEDIGGVVVGYARELRHPFELFIRMGGRGGFYDAFAEGDGRLMLAVAAARAGYRDAGRNFPGSGGDNEGAYNPFNDSYEIIYENKAATAQEAKWDWQHSGWALKCTRNLGQTDWDAVLIPVRRAWSGRVNAWQNRPEAGGKGGGYEPGMWERDSANAVLEHLWSSARWESHSGETRIGLVGHDWVLPGEPRVGRVLDRDRDERRVRLGGFGESVIELARSLYH